MKDSRLKSDDHFHDECGVFGIFGRKDAAAITTLGLHALQHRGQEAAGIISYDGQSFHTERHLGLIGDTFTQQSILEKLPGNQALGHTRYSTTGGDGLRNVQPFLAELSFGSFAVAHNGNITNALALRNELKRKGAIFSSTSDTEVILHLIATSEKETLNDRFIDTIQHLEGSFSLIAMTQDKMIGCRDALGIRPLVLGRIEDAQILASETCALDIIGADFVRDIKPGEVFIFDTKNFESKFPFQETQSRFCIFEYIYFARPDSRVEGRNVYSIRKRIGTRLAIENPVTADVVIPIPDSGTPAAIGFSQQAGIPFELGIIRNHYVGRTFIQPGDAIRHMGVKLKHNANRDTIEGRNVVLIDDSIVRGTTSKKIVQMVRNAGARKIHMCIASPPTRASCFYGVDTPEKEKLLASSLSVKEMAEFIGVDSLGFLSLEGLYQAVGNFHRNSEKPQFCDACFSNEYPTYLTDMNEKMSIENFKFQKNRNAQKTSQTLR